MARDRTLHRCTTCGDASPRWVGRCAGCGDWNTMVEEKVEPAARVSALSGVVLDARDAPVPLASVDPAGFSAVPTALDEVDRVLGGGLVPGSATLLGGEPGVGKSTLSLQIACARAAMGAPVLYVSAEESAHQLRHHARRLGEIPAALHVSAAIDVASIEAAVAACDATLVVIDSIQTIHDTDLSSAPGSVGQVRACAARLVQMAKRRDVSLVLVGHVTKEGALAGPRVLEHLVDTVLSIEGDRNHALRMLRATKHRFGPTGELGVFEMTGEGLRGVPDAGGLFLEDRLVGVPGSVVLPTVEGARTLLVEVQALVTPTVNPMPRRSSHGIDSNRLALLLAVLGKRAQRPLDALDVFTSVVGGVRVQEPAADLAVALALVSAAMGVPLPAGMVVMGEVGLAGEVRQVARLDQRLAEAERLGFDHALVPAGSSVPDSGMIVHRIESVTEALDAVALTRLRAT